MSVSRSLVVLFVMLWSSASAAPSAERPGEERPVPVIDGPGVLLQSSSGSKLVARETAGPDTFALYGGPDHPTEGKFQLEDGQTPDWGDGSGLPGGWGGGPAAWSPVDLTDAPEYWHRSTFNAANLNGNGAGNVAMWCGAEVGDPGTEHWAHLPGYGNNWSESLLYESGPLADPSLGQTVQLDFFFNHDLESGFDFLRVQYDSAGTWTTVARVDGHNNTTEGIFEAPGVRFSDVQTHPIVYAGNDYGYPGEEQIRLRLLVTSDGAWSDEDGIYPTLAGAAQVDDISLTTSEGSWSEDFEAPGPWLFNPERDAFVGDFADLYPRLTDIDPCRENLTPVAGFIDHDQVIRNGPALDGVTWSTGGRISLGIEYGIPGHYVVNVVGGLSFGTERLFNAILSPEILIDLPGPEDDGPDMTGVKIRFDMWKHLPLINGIFFEWAVRSALPGQPYGPWSDRNLIYYGTDPEWVERAFDVSDLIEPGAERLQLRLMVAQPCCIEFPSGAATPAPVFDNVAVYKYRVGGPVMSTRSIDLSQDGFPASGTLAVGTAAERDALDIPFSMARDVNTGITVIDPGDSVVVDVTSNIPTATIADVRMVWALATNPLFEDGLRVAPARAKDENVVVGSAGSVWTGEVVGEPSIAGQGFPVENRWFVDLPDVDFLYPGDVLHYFLQATDSDGRVSTLPGDTTGFTDFSADTPYDRSFVVRGLPSLRDAAGAQPAILVINDFGHRGDEAEWVRAFGELGLTEGVDFDSYTVKGPASLVSNGIGSWPGHGATVAQLTGYADLFYFSGDLQTGLLSNGDVTLSGNDKGDDLGLLEQWHALAGPRNAAYLGDGIGAGMVSGSGEALVYLGARMGVEFVAADVGPAIGGQVAARVVPATGSFSTTEFLAFGGCPQIRSFNHLQPGPQSEAGHRFTDPAGVPVAGAAASVVFARANGVSVTLPFGWSAIRRPFAREAGTSVRAQLLGDLLALFGTGAAPPVVDAPVTPARTELSVGPNPFNARTTVEFTALPTAEGTIRVFDLRGRMVRLLHSGKFTSTKFVWDGNDQDGATVASGIYVVRAEADGVTRTAKVALVK